MQHWTAPRSKRHAGAQAETDSPNGRHYKAYNRSGAENHRVQHVFAHQGIGLVTRCQTTEGFVELWSLFALKHTAVRLPSASVFLPRSGTQACVDGRVAVLCHAWHQCLDKVSQPYRLDHFAPHHQEVVITEVEVGFPWVRAAAVKGKLSHQAQYNSAVLLDEYVLDLSGRSSG